MRAGDSSVARHFSLLLCLVALALVLAATFADQSVVRAGGAGGPAQNDAASGQDASDFPENALVLSAARRTWSGNLTPAGTDSDWYRLGAEGAFCAEGEGTLTTPGGLTLAGSPSREPSVTRTVGARGSISVALAAPAGSVPLLGIEPMAILMAAEGSQVQGPTHYTFSFRAYDHASLDPERDGESPEAGATPATSAPLPPGCAGGRLSGANGDVEDRYHVDVVEPRYMTIGFALASGDPATVSILTPAGATYATLSSGEVADVWASEPGRWSVVVAPAGAAQAPAAPLPALLGSALTITSAEILESAYFLSTTDGPGDHQACRPSCRS